MSKKKTSQRGFPRTVAPRRPQVVIAAIVGLSLFVGWTMLAYSGALHSPPQPKTATDPPVSPASFSTPSKEFIYLGAGGRLLATEEPPASFRPDTAGLYVRTLGLWYLKHTNDANDPSNTSFTFGPPNSTWQPIAGDWNGDGIDTVGLYNPANGTFYLRDSNSTGFADHTFQFGPSISDGLTWKALAGDWNGDGTDTIGLYNRDTGVWYLKNTNTAGPLESADSIFTFGPGAPATTDEEWMPVVGDWNGDRTESEGLYVREFGLWYINGTSLYYGPGWDNSRIEDWRPVAGDWDGNGMDTPGLYVRKNGVWYLRATNNPSDQSTSFVYSFGPGLDDSVEQDWMPIVGHWQ